MNRKKNQSSESNLAEARADMAVIPKDDGPTASSPGNETVPLFLQDSRNGDQGNAQDEKDSAEE